MPDTRSDFPADPSDSEFTSQLQQLRPVANGTDTAELFYRAGKCAAESQRRMEAAPSVWSAALLAALVAGPVGFLAGSQRTGDNAPAVAQEKDPNALVSQPSPASTTNGQALGAKHDSTSSQSASVAAESMESSIRPQSAEGFSEQWVDSWMQALLDRQLDDKHLMTSLTAFDAALLRESDPQNVWTSLANDTSTATTTRETPFHKASTIVKPLAVNDYRNTSLFMEWMK